MPARRNHYLGLGRRIWVGDGHEHWRNSLIPTALGVNQGIYYGFTVEGGCIIMGYGNIS